MTTESRDTVPSAEFLAWRNDPAYPDPSPRDLERPEFEAVWNAIKGWDIARRGFPGGPWLYSGVSGNDVMHILNALPSTAAADQVRENIRAYLQYVADVEVGSILTPRGREIVCFCAEWVRNRLDEKWLADKVVPFPAPGQSPDDAVSLPEPEVRQQGTTVERDFVIIDGEPSEADSTVDAVRRIIAEWEGTTAEQTASCQAEHAARHLDRIRGLVRGDGQ